MPDFSAPPPGFPITGPPPGPPPQRIQQIAPPRMPTHHVPHPQMIPQQQQPPSLNQSNQPNFQGFPPNQYQYPPPPGVTIVPPPSVVGGGPLQHPNDRYINNNIF